MLPRYRLLAGQHIQADPSRGINPRTKKHHTRTYLPGDVFETDSPTVAADRGKFQRLDAADVPPLTPPRESAAAAATAVLPELETMSLSELKAFAGREEIDLGDAKTKDQVVARIRAEV